ncbi:hypothetical protein QOT17_022978 [Balamuthia mandrillaris]
MLSSSLSSACMPLRPSSLWKWALPVGVGIAVWGYFCHIRVPSGAALLFRNRLFHRQQPFSRVAVGPCCAWFLPWVQQPLRPFVDLRLRPYTFRSTDLPTSDEERLTLAVRVLLRVKPTALHELVESPAGLDFDVAALLRPSALRLLSETAARYEVREFLHKRSEIQAWMWDHLRNAVGDRFDVADVAIMELSVSDELRAVLDKELQERHQQQQQQQQEPQQSN